MKPAPELIAKICQGITIDDWKLNQYKGWIRLREFIELALLGNCSDKGAYEDRIYLFYDKLESIYQFTLVN